jgi:hypothetical protein
MARINSRSQTQLTAENTATADLEITKRVGDKGYKLVVATIDTNVVVRLEYANTSGGSITGRSIDYTITANGTYILPVFPLDNFVHLNFVSESGGTGATITGTLLEA